MKKKNEKKLGKHPVLNNSKLTFGQRSADRMSEFMGSWAFLWVFLLLIFIWMMINILMVAYRWDPYPFILLNLALSCISALQAPVILMSENRQAERDRAMAKYDYAVNRKAEREIQKIQEDLEEIKALLTKKKR